MSGAVTLSNGGAVTLSNGVAVTLSNGRQQEELNDSLNGKAEIIFVTSNTSSACVKLLSLG